MSPSITTTTTTTTMSYKYSSPAVSASPVQGLRRRTSNFSYDTDDDEESAPRPSRRNLSLPLHGSRPSSRSASSSSTPPSTSAGQQLYTGRILQTLIVVIVFYLVYDRHYKVNEAAARLEEFKEEEEILLGQMGRIEDSAAELRAKLKELRDIHISKNYSSLDAMSMQKEEIQKEISEWKKEYFKVNKEVHALQDFIQDTARKSLVERFGADKDVHIELDLGGSFPAPLKIAMFEEAPHASWIFLQQIENGDWANAAFDWHPSHMVSASSRKPSKMSGKLEFVEKSYHHHDAWTVGLRMVGKTYNLFINLQDNAHLDENDVCVGKIVGGLDTLRLLISRETVAKDPGGEKTFLDPPVVIQSFVVSSATKDKRRRYV